MAIPSDWKEFIELLNSNEVEYLIVGAHALGYHGVPRLTQDIDFLVGTKPENAERLVLALREFGFESLGLSPADFFEGGQFVQLGYPPNRIDLITSIPGVEFDEAWNRRATGDLDGIPASFIGLEDFLASKRAAGRMKDLGDVDELSKTLRRDAGTR